MKAGNGIIHDERFRNDPNRDDHITHAFQFWINLPSKNKAEPPEYLPVQASDVPQQDLSDERGWIKVIVGTYENLGSMIPNYSRQFLYHVHLLPGKQFTLDTENGLEYAAFTVGDNAVINDAEHEAGEFIEFDRNGGTIEISNNSDHTADVLIFGGERYTEPIVADGPFVMNSQQEIAQAYLDFHNGKYGKIIYKQTK
jgi:redox-sensitive bicupin YhaK (pirin superfamily)